MKEKIKLKIKLMGLAIILGLQAGLCVEFKKIDKALSDITESIDDINNSIDDLKENLTDLEENVEKLHELLEERYVDLENNLDKTKSELERIKYEINKKQEEQDLLGKSDSEYLEMLDNLRQVRNNLNISREEDLKYSEILSIGDIVNLVDDNKNIYQDIYSLYNLENEKTSYYKLNELRCIKSIVMTNNIDVLEASSMEEYETYLQNGYYVIGYNLVNQYSLNSSNYITSEGFVSYGAIRTLEKKDN